MTTPKLDIRPVDRAQELEQQELLEQTARLRAVIGRISRRLRPTQAGAGLTPSQIAVLFTVVRAGEIRLSGIAEKEGMNLTMVSRIAATLCEAGLIDREAGKEDRRSVMLHPTTAGRRLRERIHRERTEALADHVGDLRDAELKALDRALPVLERLAERLEEGSG